MYLPAFLLSKFFLYYESSLCSYLVVNSLILWYVFCSLGCRKLDTQRELLVIHAEQCDSLLELKVIILSHSLFVHEELNVVYLLLLNSTEVAAQVPRLRLGLKAENLATFLVTRIQEKQ